MDLFYSTKWSQISHTTWGSWANAAWKDIGFILGELGGHAEEHWPSIFSAIPKSKKDNLIRIKLKFEVYEDSEIEKKINKGIKVTIKDVEFVKRKIEIHNINL